ncbi:FGLLP motif-containing membrane protein [Nonomuraea insulae]|uniref:FGLLP motif-containing membrane protein n=1 Tax=Nonomuraea insulae TaxID=1616787 RepID=A0ABW1CEL6_9ACTN
MRLRILRYAMAVLLLGAPIAVAAPADAAAVTLDPLWGQNGVLVKAAFPGMACPEGYAVRWDQRDVNTLEPRDSNAARFQVPLDDRAYGSHLVTLECPKRKISGERTFMLVDAASDLSMTEAGAKLELHGSGYFCLNDRFLPVHLSLDWASSSSKLAEVTADEKGNFTQTVVVPPVSPGHDAITVSATCGTETTSTVAKTPVHVIGLTATPEKAHAGERVRIEGAGFDCDPGEGYAGAMHVTWDGMPWQEARADADGHLSATLTTPADASAQKHTVGAYCDILPRQSTTAQILVQMREKPSMTASPTQGQVSTWVRVTGSGFPCASATLRWEGDPARWPVEVRKGTFSRAITVPIDSRYGDRRITGECEGTTVSRLFLVRARTPSLDVVPTNPLAGTEVTVSGSRFDCGEGSGLPGPVTITLGSRTADAEADGSGAFHQRMPATATATAASGPVAVAARCRNAPDRAAQTSLTVRPPAPRDSASPPAPGDSASPPASRDPKPTTVPSTPTRTSPQNSTPERTATPPQESGPPAIELMWDRGQPGAPLPVSGTGFGCRDVQVLWDGGVVTSAPVHDERFLRDLRVPATASSGSHVITARCTSAPSIAAGAVFTAYTPPRAPQLTLSPRVGPGRTTATAVGRGYPIGCTTSVLRFDGNPVPLRGDDRSMLGGDFEVPLGAAVGEHEVELACQATATAKFQIPAVWPRSLLAASIRAPDEISFRLVVILGSLLICGLILLLLGFPAEIVNKSYEQGTNLLRHVTALARIRETMAGLPAWVQFAAFSVISAGLLTFVGPAGERDLQTAFGLLVAVVLTTLTYTLVNEALMRWSTKRAGRFRVLPGALVLATACALISRWLGLYPGYVYGLITVFVCLRRNGEPAERGDDKDRGRAVLVAAVATLALSFMAWFAWMPFDEAADRGSTHTPTLLTDSALAAVFTMGVQSVLFGLVPMCFLDGYQLTQWSRRVWAVVIAVAVFAFVHVVYADQAEKAMLLDWPAVGTMFALFLTAAVLSLLFWAYVRGREKVGEKARARPSARRRRPPASPSRLALARQSGPRRRRSGDAGEYRQ